MSLHEDDITARLTRFLARKSMPRRFENNPMAQADELRALTEAIQRSAPRSAEALADWWALFEIKLDETASSLWPVVKEVSDAARAVRGVAQIDLSGKPSLDPAEIQAKRLIEGNGFAETALYGVLACEIIARRLIDRDTMIKRRSQAFFARKDLYGEEAALRWEADAKATHEAAKIVWSERENRQPRNIQIPDISHRPEAAA